MQLHCSPRGRAGQRGFTLIEVMVVVVILGLLATLVAQSVIPHADHAKVQKAAVDCKSILEAAKMYCLNHGRVPTLEELTTRDDKGVLYLEGNPIDPWDLRYVLRAGDLRGDLEVRSAGPNRVEGDEDDISSTAATK